MTKIAHDESLLMSDGKSRGYNNPEFSSLDDAIEFAKNLPDDSQLYIKQYGLRNIAKRHMKGKTEPSGDYHWLALCQLMTPDYVSIAEPEVRAASIRYFSPGDPRTIESRFMISWKRG